MPTLVPMYTHTAHREGGSSLGGLPAAACVPKEAPERKKQQKVSWFRTKYRFFYWEKVHKGFETQWKLTEQ